MESGLGYPPFSVRQIHEFQAFQSSVLLEPARLSYILLSVSPQYIQHVCNLPSSASPGASFPSHSAANEGGERLNRGAALLLQRPLLCLLPLRCHCYPNPNLIRLRRLMKMDNNRTRLGLMALEHALQTQCVLERVHPLASVLHPLHFVLWQASFEYH